MLEDAGQREGAIFGRVISQIPDELLEEISINGVLLGDGRYGKEKNDGGGV